MDLIIYRIRAQKVVAISIYSTIPLLVLFHIHISNSHYQHLTSQQRRKKYTPDLKADIYHPQNGLHILKRIYAISLAKKWEKVAIRLPE
jgi:hypothetical protein